MPKEEKGQAASKAMCTEKIINQMRLSERIASSGQPEEREFKTIALAGYEAVINLAMPNSENAIPGEGNIVTALNMIYIHIPVPFDAPNKAQLNNFLNIMDGLSTRKVWVHCVLNYRVSAFLYHYWRYALKASDEEAQKVILPSWQPNSVWQHFMGIARIKGVSTL